MISNTKGAAEAINGTVDLGILLIRALRSFLEFGKVYDVRLEEERIASIKDDIGKFGRSFGGRINGEHNEFSE